jgi:hypothetical protein
MCSDKRVLSGGFGIVVGLRECISCDFKRMKCIYNGLISILLRFPFGSQRRVQSMG